MTSQPKGVYERLGDVLVVVTVYRDHDRLGGMIESLIPCSTPTASLWIDIRDACGHERDQRTTVIQPSGEQVTFSSYPERVGLARCLNEALGFAASAGVKYIAWVHPDMDFSGDTLWLEKCIQALEADSLIGKISPMEYRTIEAALAAQADPLLPDPFPGNACPWVMRVSDALGLVLADGYFFDPDYEIFMFEDWDLINRIVTRLGKQAMILPTATVAHEGMGTRSRFPEDYAGLFEKNQEIYRSKWGRVDGHL